MLAQCDFITVWVSRCPCGTVLINVIVNECLFYVFKHMSSSIHDMNIFRGQLTALDVEKLKLISQA